MAIQHQAARGSENFPVASKLIPPAARAQVLAFYDFARGADNIADDPRLSAAARHDALMVLKEAIDNHQINRLPPWARDYTQRVERGQIPRRYGEELLHAFMQDTQKTRYGDIDELLDYCAFSAVPVGRMMLRMCDEQEANKPAADALCTMLQLLNHVQDIKSDYETLDRIYLPQNWLEQARVDETELAATQCSAGLRIVIDQLLDVCDEQWLNAAPLMRTIRSHRLRLELAVIHAAARRLSDKLRTQDPLAGRVGLSKMDKALCLLRAWKKAAG